MCVCVCVDDDDDAICVVANRYNIYLELLP